MIDAPIIKLSSSNSVISDIGLVFDVEGQFVGINLPESRELLGIRHMQALANSFKSAGTFERPYLGMSLMTTSIN